MSRIPIAVVGIGSFGRNHLRVLRKSERAQLAGVFDINRERAASVSEGACPVFSSLEDLPAAGVQAVVVAAPTSEHEPVASRLLELGMDVLVEKPIAHDISAARRLVDLAARQGRILQVGHLERFNPAIVALKAITRVPLFFEIHRLSVFSPRSLDVDVVLDLMIHDIDILLDLVGKRPEEIRAAGLSILSGKVDIANVRMAFPGGCVANLTASRVSTERVRKLRLFQPHQYISVDYQRQDATAFTVSPDKQIGFQALNVVKDEPLRLEVEDFLECCATRQRPRVAGEDGLAALEVAAGIIARIEEHTRVVASALQSPGLDLPATGSI
ncbi:MAG TPA: Gfo/Idh/MocA family oxidoreductase [Bryobacteraceae bacterium]|nr:Gfo/Idh/MocA family oxidoreductase [Bryobacteraceae bacterium]